MVKVKAPNKGPKTQVGGGGGVDALTFPRVCEGRSTREEISVALTLALPREKKGTNLTSNTFVADLGSSSSVSKDISGKGE